MARRPTVSVPRRAARLVFRMLTAPIRPIAVRFQRHLTPGLMTWSYREILEPDERIEAVGMTVGRANDYWMTSNQALLIFATPSRSNEHIGRDNARRITYDQIEMVSAVDREGFTEVTVKTHENEVIVGSLNLSGDEVTAALKSHVSAPEPGA